MKQYHYTQSKRGKRPDWFTDLVTSKDIVTYPEYCLLRFPNGSYIRCELNEWVVINDDGSFSVSKSKLPSRSDD